MKKIFSSAEWRKGLSMIQKSLRYIKYFFFSSPFLAVKRTNLWTQKKSIHVLTGDGYTSNAAVLSTMLILGFRETLECDVDDEWKKKIHLRM